MRMKTANNKKKIIISKNEWERMGRCAGWLEPYHKEGTKEQWLMRISLRPLEYKTCPKELKKDHDILKAYYDKGNWLQVLKRTPEAISECPIELQNDPDIKELINCS
jgi:hypothetical protein